MEIFSAKKHSLNEGRENEDNEIIDLNADEMASGILNQMNEELTDAEGSTDPGSELDEHEQHLAMEETMRARAIPELLPNMQAQPLQRSFAMLDIRDLALTVIPSQSLGRVSTYNNTVNAAAGSSTQVTVGTHVCFIDVVDLAPASEAQEPANSTPIDNQSLGNLEVEPATMRKLRPRKSARKATAGKGKKKAI